MKRNSVTKLRQAGLVLVLLVVGILTGLPHVSASSLSGSGSHWHPYPTNIVQGDLVFGHGTSLVSKAIPGYWSHVGIIGWYDDNIEDWVVIEATPDNGVTFTPLKTFLSRYDTVAIQRVKTDDATRYWAVYFAYYQYGKPYNYNYFAKPEVFDDKYYCSELVWASYMWASDYKINLDEDDGHWSWKYGYAVAPQEVYDDSMTYTIYYHSD